MNPEPMDESAQIRRTVNCPVCGEVLPASRRFCERCGALFTAETMSAKAVGMVCFGCGHQASKVADRCPECAKPYTIECDACGAEAAPGVRFCPECRHDLERARFERGERLRRAMESPEGGSRLLMAYLAFALLSVLVVFLAFVTVGREHAIERFGPQWALILAFLIVLSAVLLSFFIRGKGKRPRPRRKGNLVEVYRTFNLPHAEHLCALLNSEGIQTFLHNRHVTTLTPFSLRGIEVMVEWDKLGECVEVMNAFGFESEFDLESLVKQDQGP